MAEETKSTFMRIVEEEEASRKANEKVEYSSVATDDGLVVSDKLRKAVGGEFGLRPIKYEKKKKGRLSVSFAIEDGNYIYQIEMEDQPEYPESEVVTAIIQACETVLPEQIEKVIGLPPKGMDWWVYTLIVKDIARQPGSKEFMEEKLVNKLLELRFWRR
jgi:hypothetical protein